MTSKAKRKRERTPDRPVRPRDKQPRIVPVGDIESVGTAEIEPGMPDTADLAETARPMSPLTREIAELSGGDLDASFDVGTSGEEAVGGSDPTPDQNTVDGIGTALGVADPEGHPIATTERIVARDRERWELDPASSDDFEERERDEAWRRRHHQP